MFPNSESDFRRIGSLLKPIGLRGEFVLHGESDFLDWLSQRKVLYAATGSGMTPWKVLSSRFQKERLVFRVDALPDRTAVEAARGTELYVTEKEAREALADPDFFYNSDLVGLNMIDATSGSAYGKVTGVLEMPGQNLLQVDGEKGEFLFPFTQPLVVDVDVSEGTISVDMPEGLMEINSDDKQSG